MLCVLVRAKVSLCALAMLSFGVIEFTKHSRAGEWLQSDGLATGDPLPESMLIAPSDVENAPPEAFIEEDLLPQQLPVDDWSWQWLPTGVIYHSYMAGMHEPRMALVSFSDLDGRVLWDATLGGRVGFLRYGDRDPLRPQGWELDFYGAAIARLDVENQQDLDSTDYVFGFPLTYGIDDWQFKFSYAHLSSHLGDELAIRVPGTLDERINYVRDSLVFGVSYYPVPAWRQYAEVGWAFHADGGSKPCDAQMGFELSPPGPTGPSFVPFLAANAHLRQEHRFGGDFTIQTGGLRRGEYGQAMRLGFHYYNGKSSQFEFFDNYEQQLGGGIWYDF